METSTLPPVSQAQAQQLSPPAPTALSNSSSPSTTAHSNTSSVTSNASTGNRFKVQSVPVQATLAPTSSVESGFSSSTSTHTEASLSSMGSASTPLAVQPPVTTNVAATMTMSAPLVSQLPFQSLQLQSSLRHRPSRQRRKRRRAPPYPLQTCPWYMLRAQFRWRILRSLHIWTCLLCRSWIQN